MGAASRSGCAGRAGAAAPAAGVSGSGSVASGSPPCGCGNVAGVSFGCALNAPGDDALWVDADHRLWVGDRLGTASDLDPAGPRVPAARLALGGVELDHVVDGDRGPPVAGDIAELLRVVEVRAGDVDRIELGVVAPHPDGGDVKCAVLPDGGDAG